MVDLSVSAPGLDMSNPLMLASGIQGANAASLHRVAASGAGGLVSKSIGPLPREMYPGPVCVEAATNVVLNAMGLPNPGVDVFAEMIESETFSKPLLVSIFGGNSEEFAAVAGRLVDAGAKSLELNLSCPHAKPGSRALIIGQQPELIEEVVGAVADAVNVPLYAKLTPNTTTITDEAGAAVSAGASGLSLINTVSALEVDPYVGRPIIGNLMCGLSGPAVRPIAQRKLAEVSLAMRRDEINTVPILGMGGITSGLDVARFIMLGATAVQVGTALVDKDVAAFEEILTELESMMTETGYANLAQMRGAALDAMEGIN
jgi:dihydroorotate dehydrogenase (NAD+) catalytic subunit